MTQSNALFCARFDRNALLGDRLVAAFAKDIETLRTDGRQFEVRFRKGVTSETRLRFDRVIGRSRAAI